MCYSRECHSHSPKDLVRGLCQVWHSCSVGNIDDLQNYLNVKGYRVFVVTVRDFQTRDICIIQCIGVSG